jgi:hypothetical protein
VEVPFAQTESHNKRTEKEKKRKSHCFNLVKATFTSQNKKSEVLNFRQ